MNDNTVPDKITISDAHQHQYIADVMKHIDTMLYDMIVTCEGCNEKTFHSALSYDHCKTLVETFNIKIVSEKIR